MIGMGFELLFDLGDFDRLAPLDFHFDGIQAEGVGNIQPALAELAAVDDQHFVAGGK